MHRPHDWLFAPAFGPGRRDAKTLRHPGSGDARKIGVSGQPGSRERSKHEAAAKIFF